MLTGLRIIARCLRGQSSTVGAIKKSSIKLFSTTKPMFDDGTNPAVMTADNLNTDQSHGDNTTNDATKSSAFASESFGTPGVQLVSEPMGESTIVDINIDDMMYEDSELRNTFSYYNETNVYSPVDGAPIAPVDVDPWADEATALDGTTEAEKVEKQREEFIYPPIPKDREGVYEFKGIKIELPKSMMRDSTYRYRLTPEERATLPDDTRIVIFDPPEVKNNSNAEEVEEKSIETNIEEVLKTME